MKRYTCITNKDEYSKISYLLPCPSITNKDEYSKISYLLPYPT